MDLLDAIAGGGVREALAWLLRDEGGNLSRVARTVGCDTKKIRRLVARYDLGELVEAERTRNAP